MKSVLILLPAALMLGACVTASEYDQDKAYAKCADIPVSTFRDRCYADAVAEAERERQRDAERMKEMEEAAEERELGRVIAGAEQD